MLLALGPHYVALDRLVWAEFVPAVDRRPDQLRLHFDVDRFPACVLEGEAIAAFRRVADRYAGGGPEVPAADPDVPSAEHLQPLTEGELAELAGHSAGPWRAGPAAADDELDTSHCFRISGGTWHGFALVVAHMADEPLAAKGTEGMSNIGLITKAPRLLADVRRLRAANADLVLRLDSAEKLLQSVQSAPPPR